MRITATKEKRRKMQDPHTMRLPGSGPCSSITSIFAPQSSYVDVSVAPNRRKRLKIETTRNAFAYVFAGSGTFRDASDPRAVLTESAVNPNANPKYDARNHSLVLFDRGDEIAVQAGEEGIRFLL